MLLFLSDLGIKLSRTHCLICSFKSLWIGKGLKLLASPSLYGAEVGLANDTFSAPEVGRGLKSNWDTGFIALVLYIVGGGYKLTAPISRNDIDSIAFCDCFSRLRRPATSSFDDCNSAFTD